MCSSIPHLFVLYSTHTTVFSANIICYNYSGSDSSSSAVNNIPVYVSIGVGCLLVIAVVIVIIIVQRKLRMIGKKYTENGTEQK